MWCTWFSGLLAFLVSCGLCDIVLTVWVASGFWGFLRLVFGCVGSGGYVCCRSGVLFWVLGFSSFHTGWYVAGFVVLVCLRC